MSDTLTRRVTKIWLLAVFASAASFQAQAEVVDWKKIDQSTFFSSQATKDGSSPRKLPETAEARAFADFDGDGVLDYFVASVRYISYFSMDEDPKTAKKSDFRIYRGLGNGKYELAKSILDGDASGCVHPRKAVLNDFNRDGVPDVFVACHGWDKDPFPGERSKIVLSSPGNAFLIQDAFDHVGFTHSATSADVDGNGAADLVITDSKSDPSVLLWLGNEDGSFERSKFKLKGVSGRRPYFTSEFADFNGDGRYDLFVAGHENGGAKSYIFLNGSDVGFGQLKRVEIPKIIGAGTVLDILASSDSKDDTVYILRTGDDTTEFYRGVYVQEYEIGSQTSRTVIDLPQRKWIPWLTSWRVGGEDIIGSDDLWEKPLH